jgi:putative ABC transport system permease protein
LTLEDAKDLGFAKGVEGVASVIAKTLQIQYLEANTSARVSGVTPEYNELREWNLLYGNYLSEQDIKRSSRVAVVGLTVAKELFGRTDVEGKIIRIKNVPFRISGVLAEKGSSITGRDQDNTILVPITTARKYLIKSKYPRSVSYIILKVKEEVDIERVQKNLELLLRVAHRLRDDEKNDFSISNLADISSTAETATEALRILLASIAGISLLVGGVGIMNIMLVNVTERTREIGIRLAIGASREDILRQFLIESALVCLTGGCLGILFGIFVSFLIASFTPVFVQVSITSILLSFFISIGIGVFFGWYPARKASLMEPVVALRSD